MRVLTTAAVLTVACLSAAPARAQDGSESFYIQALIGYAKLASTAAACGLRSQAWATSLRSKVLATITAHAGSPMENPHTPTEAERAIATRSFGRSEAAGQRDAENSVICDVVRRMGLTTLDDYEDGAVSLWPDME